MQQGFLLLAGDCRREVVVVSDVLVVADEEYDFASAVVNQLKGSSRNSK